VQRKKGLKLLLLAGCIDNCVRVYSPKSGAYKATVNTCLRDGVTAMMSDRSSHLLAVGDACGTVQLFDLRLLVQMDEISRRGFIPGPNFIAHNSRITSCAVWWLVHPCCLSSFRIAYVEPRRILLTSSSDCSIRAFHRSGPPRICSALLVCLF
jgi:hypothetical protein